MDAKIKKSPTKEELDYIVSSAFPDNDGYKTTVLNGGLFNTSYLLEVCGAKYVLRVGPEDRHLLYPYEMYLMDAEAWAYREMSRIGIPTSTLTYIDTTKKALNRDFMIVEYIDSTGMNAFRWEWDNERVIYKEIGRLTRKMSEITGDKFGRVGKILHGEGYDRWSDYIKGELSEWADTVRRNAEGYYTEEELERIVGVADKHRDVLDDIKVPHFNHCDIWQLNILVPKSGEPVVKAVIDPDRCCMGDPDYELSSGWMMNDAFYEGYGRRMAEDERTVIRTSIYKMMFFILNGYFMWVQYDDRENAASDKERGMYFLKKL